MKKKMVAMLLTTAMVVSTLTGCGASSGDDSRKTQPLEKPMHPRQEILRTSTPVTK